MDFNNEFTFFLLMSMISSFRGIMPDIITFFMPRLVHLSPMFEISFAIWLSSSFDMFVRGDRSFVPQCIMAVSCC